MLKSQRIEEALNLRNFTRSSRGYNRPVAMCMGSSVMDPDLPDDSAPAALIATCLAHQRLDEQILELAGDHFAHLHKQLVRSKTGAAA